MRSVLVLVVMVAVAAVLAPVARAAEPINLPWTTLLPALPSPAGNTGGPQPHCKRGRLKCITVVMRRLRARQAHFGCDHRGVFATTYLELTREMRATLTRDPAFFRDRRALIFEDALFAQIYFNTLKRYRLGQTVDPAWQTALDSATTGDLQGAGDMLLGINAHVQNDMPFLLASITLRDAKGVSRKPDHDQENKILDAAFDGVVKAIAARYDPLTALETYDLSPLTDVFGIELVKVWRESVWRNAERLVNAKSAAERREVADSIHQQAAVTADLIVVATQGPPGYRASRDAYCAAQAG